MTNQELRKSICDSLKLADRRTLKMIKALMVEYHAPDDGEDEEELFAELERRSKAIESGIEKTYAAEDAVEYIRKNRKKRKK